MKLNDEQSKLEKVADKDNEDYQEDLGAIDIFKSTECRKATLAMFIIWMSVSLSK